MRLRNQEIFCCLAGFSVWFFWMTFMLFSDQQCQRTLQRLQQQLESVSQRLRLDFGDERSVGRGDRVVVTACTREQQTAAIRLAKDLRKKGGYQGQIIVIHVGIASELLSLEAVFSNDAQTRVVPAAGLFPSANLSLAPPLPCENSHSLSLSPDDAEEVQSHRRAWTLSYSKLGLFSEYFRQWHRVLWLDSDVHVHRPSVDLLFNEIDATGVIMAHPDNWLNNQRTVGAQFCGECEPSLYTQLNRQFDMNSKPFQSTIFLFDTQLITSSTVYELARWFHDYHPISKGPDGLLSMYFTNRGVMRTLPYRLDSNEVPFDTSPRFQFADVNELYIMTTCEHQSISCTKRG